MRYPKVTVVGAGQVGATTAELLLMHDIADVNVVDVADADRLPRMEPVYPLTEGVSLKILGRAMASALALVPPLPEWQDRAFLDRQGWPSFAEAMLRMHRPQEPSDLAGDSPFRQPRLPSTVDWRRLPREWVRAGRRDDPLGNPAVDVIEPGGKGARVEFDR